MPLYSYKCEGCGITKEIFQQGMDPGIHMPICEPCGRGMRRDFAADAPNIGGKDYVKPIVSDSLAMNPSQIAEHRQLFPNIEVTREGQPIFDNAKTHNDYLEARGLYKETSKRQPTNGRTVYKIDDFKDKGI